MNVSKPSMSVMGAICRRRSIRSYLPTKIDQDTVRSLLSAAVWAPTAMHEETWAFVIIQDSNVLKRLSDRAKSLLIGKAQRDQHLLKEALDQFTSPGFNIFYDASTLIVICGKPLGPYVAADCWLAAENLLLAACSMGLGTCVIGLAVEALQDPHVKVELAIPDDMTAIVPIIVGMPRGDAPTTQRKEPQIIAWK